MNSNTKKKSWWEKVIAPFMVLKIEKFYLFWIVSYLISFAGVIVDIFNGNLSTSIHNGIIFSTCMAVIAPLFIEFLTDYISGNRQKSKEEYAVYKGWTMGLCFIGLILLFLFYVTKIKSSWIVQLICLIIAFVLSFYTYLVTKMQIHDTLLNDFKDKTYTEMENEEISMRNGNSKKLKKATLAEGVEIKL